MNEQCSILQQVYDNIESNKDSNKKSNTESNTDSNLINNKYKLGSMLSKGSFGKVYHIININNNEKLLVKTEERDTKTKTLEHEAKVLTHLKKCSNVVKLIWYGHDLTNNYLVMNNLGKSLMQIIKRKKKISLKTSTLLFIKGIDILKDIHESGIIHRDIKPDNFVIDKNNSLWLIDFGLSKSYLRKKKHCEYCDNKSFIGTTRYASINVHNGINYSRRDDLESLFYVILFLFNGTLPWQGIDEKNKTLHKKKVCSVKSEFKNSETFNNLPIEYQMVYSNIKTIEYQDEPNYSFLSNVLLRLRNN